MTQLSNLRPSSLWIPACCHYLTLTYTLNPAPNPKPCLNAGSKPKAGHKLSTLANLHPKPSLSPCRLEALYLLILNPKLTSLKLNPKPQNPTTTPQGEEGPHATLQGAGEGMLDHRGRRGGACDHVPLSLGDV